MEGESSPLPPKPQPPPSYSSGANWYKPKLSAPVEQVGGGRPRQIRQGSGSEDDGEWGGGGGVVARQISSREEGGPLS